MSIVPSLHTLRRSRTLVEVLRNHAECRPDSKAFTFLSNGETEAGSLTFASLHRQARAIAASLRADLSVGHRVVLLFPSGLDFIVAFLGCLYAGVIAVPVAMPRKQQGLEKLVGIATDCAASAVLTDQAHLVELAARKGPEPALAALPLRALDACETEPVDDWDAPRTDANTMAFLQYTSGSTGAPKGVVISHGNLLANQETIRQAFGHGEHTVVVGWLPLHHDMGLVGNILQPLFLGIHSVLMPPTAFTQQPLRWLAAISKYRATTSGAPNFAYEMCARRISEEALCGLSLDSWQVAFCGAEPVRAETLGRFARRYARAGFSAKAFYPCYGMAEATLFVSGGTPGQGPVVKEVDAQALERNVVQAPLGDVAHAPRRKLVGCGRAHGDQTILVVDPESAHPCPDRRVGEVWLRGSSLAAGYWGDIATQAFAGRLADGSGPFLRTGDLGFLDGGELFITGRCKELIIVKGRNLYPHDVERCISRSHPALNGAMAAAFALETDAEERLVVVHEVAQRRLTEEHLTDIQHTARDAVAREFDARLHDLVLVLPGGIPKTTSGKLQRGRCRDLYRNGALATVKPTRDCAVT